MLKLGVIGTSWISRQFIDAALETRQYRLSAVYSRSLSKAKEFTADFAAVGLFDNLEKFARADLDVVYIASPNSLHFTQVKTLILAGKHVIVEKPAFSNPREFAGIFEMALEKHVYVFEAARNIHDAGFHRVKDFLADKTIVGANLTYAKYSSKMPALLAGELPNKWNPKFSAGILADLGVYLLYFTICLFGEADSVSYQARLLPSGVDVSGNGLLRYKDFDVTIFAGGNLNSYLASEIYTTDGTLVLDSIAQIGSAEFISYTGEHKKFELQPRENPLFEEARDFANFLANPEAPDNCQKFTNWYQLAQKVNQTSYQMRQDAGIKFEADV